MAKLFTVREGGIFEYSVLAAVNRDLGFYGFQLRTLLLPVVKRVTAELK